MTLLQLRDLAVDFALADQTVHAVRGIDLDVDQGRTVALVGESGSGKSTTALSVLQLNPAPPATYRGQIGFDGRNLLDASPAELRRVRGSAISMIFQDPMSSLNPLARVGKQVQEVLRLHRPQERGDHRRLVLEALPDAGIDDPQRRAEQYPHELSGGLRQRVMIAMALVARPRLLIADEPTTALDVTVQAEILALLRNLQSEHGMAILLITHDLGVVATLAHRVAVMRGGQIVEQGEVQQIFDAPNHDYTRTLLEVTPRLPQLSPAQASPGGRP